MTAFSKVEAILVRATVADDTSYTYIRDVSMDAGVDRRTGTPAAGIEDCRCPVGYRGKSCEQCADGYYRDRLDRSEVHSHVHYLHKIALR